MPKPLTTTTLNVRQIDRDAVARIKRHARARGLTLGQYLGRLALLHEEVRALEAEPRVKALLARLELATVTT